MIAHKHMTKIAAAVMAVAVCLCLALEAVEDSFLLRNYGTQSGELYKPEGVDGGRGGKNGDFADKEKNFIQYENTGENIGITPTVQLDSTQETGQMPEGFDPAQMEGMAPPDRQDFADSGDGGDSRTLPQRPDGDQPPAGDRFGGQGGDLPELPENADPGQAGAPFSAAGGADLKYTDDELDSYATIWYGEVTNTSETDHKRVVTALKNIAEGTDLETYMDVDNLLKYMAIHAFSVNLDSLSGNMAHNYYLYESNGQLNLLPWDYNLAFGGFGGSADSVINNDISDPFSGTDFFDTLLENETYRAQYETYLRQLSEEYVQGGGLAAFFTRTRSQIDRLVQDDPTAFYTYDQYDAAAQMLLEVVQLRAQSVTLQLDGSSEKVDASGIDLTVMGGMNNSGFGGKKPE